jgi:hypothetical protein
MGLLIAKTRWGHLRLIKSHYVLLRHAVLAGSNKRTHTLQSEQR